MRVQQVRERHERRKRVHGEQEHGREEAHALHVPHVRAVEHVGLQHLAQLRL